MFIFIGVEDRSISSFVSLGVTGLVAVSVTAHGIPGYFVSITGAVASMFSRVISVFPVRFFIGSAICVLK